jgi:hypothetical protein
MMDITRRQLEGAFTAEPVEVTSTLDVFTRDGTQIHSFRYPVSNPEGTARRFWEHLAAHRDPDGWPCENEVGHAQALADALGRPVEDPGPDPELAAMAALLPGLPLVSKLDPDARERVMDWARRRATDGQPPF